MNIISYLQKKKIIFQITDKKNLKKNIYKKNIKLYCGFDPTSNSLHIGHILLLMVIKKFSEYNHIPFIIIGGSTSLIGDPSFKKEKKIIYNIEKIKIWSKNISNQISNILNINNNKIFLLNNFNWLNKLKFIDFLCKIGKYIKINNILNRDFIKNRLNNKNNKLLLNEFLYNILQGYDFLYLNNKYNIILQLGGADQWCNIISGINLIKKINNKKTYGITLPILTNNKGFKINKSDDKKSVIWLDKNKTSFYKFYQYWLNINDNFLKKYLYIFTDLNDNEISEICNNNNYKNFLEGKKIIADKLTKFIHGNHGLNKAIEITKSIFYKNIYDLKEVDFINISKNIDTLSLYKNNNLNIKKILILFNITNSNSKSIRLLKQNSIKINNFIIKNENFIIDNKNIFYNKYTILSVGKKNFYLIIWK